MIIVARWKEHVRAAFYLGVPAFPCVVPRPDPQKKQPSFNFLSQTALRFAANSNTNGNNLATSRITIMNSSNTAVLITVPVFL